MKTAHWITVLAVQGSKFGFVEPIQSWKQESSFGNHIGKILEILLWRNNHISVIPNVSDHLW